MAGKDFTVAGIPEPTADLTSILRTTHALRTAMQTIVGDRNPNSKGLLSRVGAVETSQSQYDIAQAQANANIIKLYEALAGRVSALETGGGGGSLHTVMASNPDPAALNVSATLSVGTGHSVDILALFGGQPSTSSPVADAGKLLKVQRTGSDGTTVDVGSMPVQYTGNVLGVLPTSPPAAAGQLWNNNGVLSVTGSGSQPAFAGLYFLQTTLLLTDTPPAGATTYKLLITGGTAQGPLLIKASERVS